MKGRSFVNGALSGQQLGAVAGLEHLQDAVAGGEPPETLIAAIRERERRQKDIESQLRALEHAPALRAAAPQLRREAKALLDDWRGLLGRQVSTTRQLLRKLLDGERFVFHPQREGEERWYELAVRPTLDKFFSAVPALKKAVASEGNRTYLQTGIPRISPRGLVNGTVIESRMGVRVCLMRSA